VQALRMSTSTSTHTTPTTLGGGMGGEKYIKRVSVFIWRPSPGAHPFPHHQPAVLYDNQPPTQGGSNCCSSFFVFFFISSLLLPFQFLSFFFAWKRVDGGRRSHRLFCGFYTFFSLVTYGLFVGWDFLEMGRGFFCVCLFRCGGRMEEGGRFEGSGGGEDGRMEGGEKGVRVMLVLLRVVPGVSAG
jgi:hypothetical protein